MDKSKNRCRLSDEQLMRGVCLTLGGKITTSKQFDFDTPVIDVVNEEIAPNLRWFYRDLCMTFGQSLTWEEENEFVHCDATSYFQWKRDIAPLLTFRVMAEHAARNVDPISFDEVTVLGRPCQAAGAYLALEKIASEIKPDAAQIAPSTPILAHLRGHLLMAYWERLRILLGEQVPDFTAISRRIGNVLGSALLLLIICYVPIYCWITGEIIVRSTSTWHGIAWIAAECLTLALGIIGMVAMFLWLHNLLDPYRLPTGIKTFRDLAVAIANKRNSASKRVE